MNLREQQGKGFIGVSIPVMLAGAVMLGTEVKKSMMARGRQGAGKEFLRKLFE